MNQTFNKQPIAFVTGASSGFGLLTSVALAGEGYRVLASMRNLINKGRLEAAAKEAGVADRIEIVQLDVTDFSAAETVIQDVIRRYGQIDLLVNNAGYAAGSFTEEVAIEEWQRQFETNFFGLVAVTKAVLPSMRERRSGKIVNISSISGRIGFPSMGPYVASKFAVEGFSESLRLEMLPYGVHVVLIEPGSYKTDIWSKGLGAVTIHPNSPYVKEMKAILKYVNKIADAAPAPDEVIRQIVQVAKSPSPKLRYPVGKGVKLGIILKNILPWKWWERIVTKRLWKG
ncbi:oxidoreductase [Parageobacillus thermoglucosidasius]|uniref:oxidoreductase n=1 Tax=Parageobacillus thermoglucosidasius TaxID=1426 RepID=UPI00025B76DB|nr:oxidoreductase [Parageobacillus thermoglucosidasius]KYD18373.1 3-oxoacyl-[acyl-carrier protein] reductase [Anoxybacillus flavithermus]REK53702.1 MAG: short-chain dehydrogenase [Geobacillus sp.]EID44470.1 short-chain dehydrogenase/reductase SDR, NAD(P)(+)-binding [Parageobacillus thermoglucosidasius TNO-09.020]OAO83753.1 3-oxoacyl-(acyl-carrier protein) reductase [Parageobacillus thermoglucosidasius]GMO00997.1 oxidoreductase [Parageobacillus thermoglucosidasius]